MISRFERYERWGVWRFNNVKIDNKYAIELNSQLKMNKKIHTLIFDIIEVDSVIAICELLKINKTIHTLKFYENIGDNGLIKLSEALKINKTIHTLELYKNFGNDAVVEIIKTLDINRKICSLNFRSTKIDIKLLEQINILNKRNIKLFLFDKMNNEGCIKINNYDYNIVNKFNTFFNCINLLQINEQNHLSPELERYLGVSILIEFLFYAVDNYPNYYYLNYYFRLNSGFQF